MVNYIILYLKYPFVYEKLLAKILTKIIISLVLTKQKHLKYKYIIIILGRQ